MKRLIVLPFIIFATFTALAQAAEPATDTATSGHFYTNIMISILLVFALILLLVAWVVLRAVRSIEYVTFHQDKIQAVESERMLEYDEWHTGKKTSPSVLNKLLGLKPLEEEAGLVLDEDYDGIKELNNPTPAWFMVLFYSTIVFGIVYMLTYHVFDWGKLQDDEYAAELQKAKTEQRILLAGAANLVDENSVKESSDAGTLAEGKSVFMTNCAPCHGNNGQGVVGPNLTDEYWLHGGKINAIFKVIKYGVQEKGMISWEKKLTPKQIAGVSNYILTLKGTKPEGAKEAQGVEED